MERKFVIKNYTEEAVELYLGGCLDVSGVCRCERCEADIRAYVLNHLPPHYVVSRMGDTFTRVEALSGQSEADIISVITQAIMTVRKNPRHDSAR